MIVPVNVPVVTADGKGAATDATGAFTSTDPIHPANWAVVRLVGQIAGPNQTGVWTLAADNGLPLDFATGGLVSMGLVLVAPGQRLVLTITDATPASVVLAQFVGVMSPRLEEVLPFYIPAPNPVGSTIAAPPRRLLGLISTGPNTTSPVSNFILSGKPRSIGLQALAPGNLSNVTITGHQSGTVYYNAVPAGTLMEFAMLDAADDSSVDVTITAGLGGTSPQVAFFSVFSDDFVSTRIQSAVPLSLAGTATVDVTDRAARLVGVVQEGANPPLWQSPNKAPANYSFALAAGATATVVAAVGGQTVRVFSIQSEQPNGSGNSFGQWQDTAGTPFANTDLSQQHLPSAWPLFGSPLALGTGLQFKNTSGVAMGFSYQGGVAYSQG